MLNKLQLLKVTLPLSSIPLGFISVIVEEIFNYKEVLQVEGHIEAQILGQLVL